MKIDIVNADNKKVGSLELNDEVFGGRVNRDLIWESVVQQNAAERREEHAQRVAFGVVPADLPRFRGLDLQH